MHDAAGKKVAVNSSTGLVTYPIGTYREARPDGPPPSLNR